VASEVQQLTSSMTNVANRKLGDRFIFGGFRTQAPPFTARGDYKGDEGEMSVHADKEAFIPMNVPGSRVFLGIGIDANGASKGNPPQAKSVAQLDQQNEDEPIIGAPELTADLPESIDDPDRAEPLGMNVFQIMSDLEISLRTNDKGGVQDQLEKLDAAINQVVTARSQVGARATAVDNLSETMAKAKVQDQVQISSLEDADVFETVSDINKTQSTLQATLQTSGKLVQQSLMDFLR
jgi:flagellar hook-associated protein 3 FlgL